MKRIWLAIAIAAMFGCDPVRHHPNDAPRPVERLVPPAELTKEASDAPRTPEETPAGLALTPVIPAVSPVKHSPTVEEVNAELRDVYFDYDRSDPDSETLGTLRSDAQLLLTILREFPNLKVIVEGHCDDRGSAEYNIGLGERRASRVLDILREYGMPQGNAQLVSYGKEAPQCLESSDPCRHLNRRAHMVVQ
jgi:peptidoglycan-associated lipoprotein